MLYAGYQLDELIEGCLLERSTLLTGVLTSQIISNVPAAVLLSGFTDNWRELLLGVDIGGLGTPVASLASLITLKLYLRSPGARPARYLAVFTAWNAALLAVMLAVGLRPVLWKLLLVVILQWCTSPLSGHMLAQFEYRVNQNLEQHLELPDGEQEAGQ